METNRTNKIILIAAALLIGLAGGYFYGSRTAKKTDDQRIKDLQDSLSVYVTPLPDTVTLVAGKITGIQKDSFTLEIPSLTDRYPHPNKPLATETKTIRVTDAAKITSTIFGRTTTKNGFPEVKTITLKDLKIGDTMISVVTKENARTQQTLTAVQISKTVNIQ